MKRCSKCVLPETTPQIAFDKEGVCNYCREYQRLQYQGEAELVKFLDAYRRKNSKYDCIVTISGGRDSTFTLLKLAKDYKMRVLAVNYENPYAHPQAKVNIDNAAKILGVDLIRFNLINRIHERTFKNNVQAWFRKPSPGLVPMMCVACKNLWWEILKIAKTNDVHCVISGGNRFEEISFKKVLLHTSADEKAETTLIKEIFGLLKTSSQNLAYFKPRFIPTLFKGYLFGNPYALGSRFFKRGVEGIDLFFFIPWSEKEVVSRITSELNWDYPRQYHSTWRFDCRLGHMKDYMYLQTLGLTEKDDYYAKMAREGFITREEALKRLSKENVIPMDEIKILLKEAGIEYGQY